MLAYVFWHRPGDAVAPADYERALARLHRSLSRHPPVGFRSSATLRAGALPWLAAAEQGSVAPAYEDWYLVESYAALGALEAAALAGGHRSAHDAAARSRGRAAAGLYRLLEGHPDPGLAHVSVWIDPARGHAFPLLADLLADGMDAERCGLWQRVLMLGPAPEYCLIGPTTGAGVAPTRLPRGWSALHLARESIAD